ncbi:hypothetical protein ACFLX2_00150 [Candidatus Dependentiae bacterium]
MQKKSTLITLCSFLLFASGHAHCSEWQPSASAMGILVYETGISPLPTEQKLEELARDSVGQIEAIQERVEQREITPDECQQQIDRIREKETAVRKLIELAHDVVPAISGLTFDALRQSQVQCNVYAPRRVQDLAKEFYYAMLQLDYENISEEGETSPFQESLYEENPTTADPIPRTLSPSPPDSLQVYIDRRPVFFRKSGSPACSDEICIDFPQGAFDGTNKEFFDVASLAHEAAHQYRENHEDPHDKKEFETEDLTIRVLHATRKRISLLLILLTRLHDLILDPSWHPYRYGALNGFAKLDGETRDELLEIIERQLAARIAPELLRERLTIITNWRPTNWEQAMARAALYGQAVMSEVPKIVDQETEGEEE